MTQEDGDARPDEAASPDEPTSRRSPAKLAAVVLLVVVALSAATYSALRVRRREQRRKDAGTEQVRPMEAYKIPDPVGSEDAELHITVVMGHCVAPVMDNFVTLAEAWPDKIHADFYAYEGEAGSEIVKSHGQTLACVFFNDENRFTVPGDDGEREVHFHGPPGGGYNMADVIAVLRMQLIELYGELPPDFDEVTDAFRSAPVPDAG